MKVHSIPSYAPKYNKVQSFAKKEEKPKTMDEIYKTYYERHNTAYKVMNYSAALVMAAALAGATYSSPDYKQVKEMQNIERNAEKNLNNYLVDEEFTENSKTTTITDKKSGQQVAVQEFYNNDGILKSSVLTNKETGKEYYIRHNSSLLNGDIRTKDGEPINDEDRKDFLILIGIVGAAYLSIGRVLAKDLEEEKKRWDIFR